MKVPKPLLTPEVSLATVEVCAARGSPRYRMAVTSLGILLLFGRHPPHRSFPSIYLYTAPAPSFLILQFFYRHNTTIRPSDIFHSNHSTAQRYYLGTRADFPKVMTHSLAQLCNGDSVRQVIRPLDPIGLSCSLFLSFARS